MTTIYLIRHAEAEGNVFRRLHGQYDSMVTPNGMKQIAALRERFAQIPVDAVYSSDLVRTCTTAGAIYKPKGLPLRKEPRFREIGVGVWEDIPFGQLDHDDPTRNYAFSHTPRLWSVEGSEPFAVYTGRFLQALEEVARRHDGQTVAIFSHGMVLRGALQTLFFPDDDNAIAHCENTAVTRIRWADGEYTLDFLNDASHIPYEISTLGRQQWWRGDGRRDFNMWFRPQTPADAPLLSALGCAPSERQRVRISVLGQTPVGVLVTQDAGADGELVFLGLLEPHRGIGLSAQLLGEAVCGFRAEGKRFVRLGAPVTHPAAQRLFAEYGFTGEPLRLEITPRIL